MSPHDRTNTPDPSTPGVAVAPVIDFQARLVERRQDASRRHGKGSRHRVPLIPHKIWAREYQSSHMAHMLLRHSKHFTKVELAVLWALVHLEKQEGQVSMASVQRALGQASPGRVSPAIGALAECGIVINVGSAKIPHLVVQPVLGYWNLARLAESHGRPAPSYDPEH